MRPLFCPTIPCQYAVCCHFHLLVCMQRQYCWRSNVQSILYHNWCKLTHITSSLQLFCKTNCSCQTGQKDQQVVSGDYVVSPTEVTSPKILSNSPSISCRQLYLSTDIPLNLSSRRCRCSGLCPFYRKRSLRRGQEPLTDNH